MRRALLIAVLAGALTVLTAVAAPALTSEPYVPPPVDFELAPVGAAAGEQVGGDVVSRPLDAPKRFDLVGLQWKIGDPEAHVEVRVRREGAEWSPWTDATPEPDHAPDPGRGEHHVERVSAPVWADGADEVQYRTSERLGGVKVKFINTTGTATAADRAETAVRRAANKGLAGVARLFSAGAVSQPSMVTRDEWGASQYCPPRRRSDAGSVKAVFVHHTATANGYSSSDGPSMVRGICRWHVYNNGWDDIGYNFLVDKYGQIYEGRNGGVRRANVGAQAQGWNAQSTGIANIGTHSSSGQSTSGLRALERLIVWKLTVHNTPLGGRVTLVSAGGPLNRYPEGQRVSFNRISGHRDGNRTDCPGDALYAQLPRLRRAVENGADTTPPAAPTNLTARSGPGSVALNWDDNTESDLAGYRIYRRTLEGTYASIATTRSSAFTDYSVRGGETYFYRVKAYDTSGNHGYWSNYVKGLPTVPWDDVVDNSNANRFTASSNWGTSSRVSTRRGADYRYARPEKVSDAARFHLTVPHAGAYAIYVWHPAHPDYSSSAPIGVRTSDGTRWSHLDLRSNGGRWRLLGTYSFAAGEEPTVVFSRWTSASGWLIADAVRIVER